MKELEILENQSTREGFIDQVGVLGKVKDLLLLGNSEFATTQQVADYYEVGLEAIKAIIFNNKEELISNGLKDLTGKNTKEVLGSCGIQLANHKGYFTANGIKMNNRNNLLFQKRSILNVGMLLRDSKIAKEVRSRLLDIEYESNNAIQDNGQTVKENIVTEILDERTIIDERIEAEMQGKWDIVCVCNAKLFALKNKRITDLEDTIEDITTHSLTLIESRDVINKLTRLIAIKEYGGLFGKAFGDLYKTVNYKLGINIKGRNKKKSESYLHTLTENECFKVEEIVRTWANDCGVDVKKELSLAM